MIPISDLLTEEIELLKLKFHPFVLELKTIIENSNLFFNKTNENPLKSPNYHSNTLIENRNCGLRIQWERNFSSIKFIILTKKIIDNQENLINNGNPNLYEYGEFLYYPVFLNESKSYDFIEKGNYYNLTKKIDEGIFNINSDELIFLQLVNEKISELLKDIKKIHFESLNTLSLEKKSFLEEFSKNNDGKLDLVDCVDINKLLQKHQKKIIEIDKNYIQKFVKISSYLKLKKQNILLIYNSIYETNNNIVINEQIFILNNLKQLIHSYESLLFHSISMITSVVSGDLITFYEIYECFDKLNVFNSNWENEVSYNLSNIGFKLDDIGVQLGEIGNSLNDLFDSINSMESNIISSLDKLSYITEDSFRELNTSINEELSSIDSSIKVNNLLTGIQSFQMYKINQNTKRIN
jgi:hypothetical protein